MRIRFIFVAITLLLLLAVVSNIYAQSASCQALVQQAFADLSQTCSGAGGNSACYGHSAEATDSAGAITSFAKAGDKLDLSTVQTVQTLPLDTANQQWGLALLNVQANVPLALSQTGLKYILVGDAKVENAVSPDNAFTPVAAITVTPLVAANLRSSPSTDGQVIANAPVGTELSADALSTDKAWLRVLSGTETAWVSRQIVAAKDGSIDSLPIVGTDTRTTMQAFYLHTGTDVPSCTDAPPSMLIVQAPSGLNNAAITVNGANIRFSNALALYISSDNSLKIISVSGGANVGGVSIPAGFTLSIPLTSDDHGVASPPTGLRPVTDGERSSLTLTFSDITGSVLYSPLALPTADQIAAVLVALNGAAGSQTVSGPASGKADCTRFKPTSPLGSLANGVTPFFWDGAPGATTYRVNVYGDDGSLRGSYTIDANNTTLQADTGGAIGGGSNFAWEVQALVNDQVACTTGRVSLPRDITPQFVNNGGGGPGPAPTKCTWQGC